MSPAAALFVVAFGVSAFTISMVYGRPADADQETYEKNLFDVLSGLEDEKFRQFLIELFQRRQSELNAADEALNDGRLQGVKACDLACYAKFKFKGGECRERADYTRSFTCPDGFDCYCIGSDD